MTVNADSHFRWLTFHTLLFSRWICDLIVVRAQREGSWRHRRRRTKKQSKSVISECINAERAFINYRQRLTSKSWISQDNRSVAACGAWCTRVKMHIAHFSRQCRHRLTDSHNCREQTFKICSNFLEICPPGRPKKWLITRDCSDTEAKRPSVCRRAMNTRRQTDFVWRRDSAQRQTLTLD